MALERVTDGDCVLEHRHPAVMVLERDAEHSARFHGSGRWAPDGLAQAANGEQASSRGCRPWPAPELPP